MTAIWKKGVGGWTSLQPVGFPDEASLHDLVEEAPHLLPLAGSPTLVVLGREVGLGRGSADLVAIEPSGRVVIIEVKLVRNQEVRRAIVAQVLDYASALYRLDAAAFEEILGSHLAKSHFDSLAAAIEASEVPFESELFLAGLRESLENGRFRLVLVLDDAPDDLVRIVGYLEAVTEGLLIDVVKVASYEIDGTQLLVPHRVEPERLPPPSPTPTTGETSRFTPGADAFREAIDDAPAERREYLVRLTDWAVSLEHEGAANLFTRHDVRGGKHLIVQIKTEKVGLLTIWNTGSAWLFPSVFQRRAPGSIEQVEAAIAPLELAGQSVSVSELSDALLDALAAAYREASGSARPGE